MLDLGWDDDGSPSSDAPLKAVLRELRRTDPDGVAIAQVLRETFDQLYDGGRTGRYSWSQLYKTEKTHFGTLVEINLRRRFDFPEGVTLDYRIAGHEVDAKYSQTLWGWMIPPEAVGQLCLVITASDETSRFSLGVVRALKEHLHTMNRDLKQRLSSTGRQQVRWLQLDAPMPVNTLLQMAGTDVVAVFALPPGQQRVNELFRRAAGSIVSRAAVETVAQQKDPMKRVRQNGGARSLLSPEGIVILGGDYKWQADAARGLGLPVPSRSEFVSAYVAERPTGGHGRVETAGRWWQVVSAGEADPAPVVAGQRALAPDDPRVGRG